jgi:hypothetical protein
MRHRTQRLAWLLALLVTAAGFNIGTSTTAWAVSPPLTFTVKVVPAGTPSYALCAFEVVDDFVITVPASTPGCTWWTFTRMSEYYYRITNTNTGYCLDPRTEDAPDMHSPMVEECRDGIDQLWQLSPTFGGKDASWIKAASADEYLGDVLDTLVMAPLGTRMMDWTVDTAFSVIYPGPVSISTTSVPAATAGRPFSSRLTASGGTDEYVWSLISGALPDGLKMNSLGLILGTPVKEASTTVTVRATSLVPGQRAAIQDVSITVNPAT